MGTEEPKRHRNGKTGCALCAIEISTIRAGCSALVDENAVFQPPAKQGYLSLISMSIPLGLEHG